MSKQQRNLFERIIEGDPQALIAVWKQMNDENDEETIDQAVEVFDDASFAYAIGESTDPENEWCKFREVIAYDRNKSHALTQIDRLEERLARSRFERKILESLLANAKSDQADQIREAIEMNGYSQEMLESDLIDEQQRATFLQSWIDEARKDFTTPRFASLPPELFDELVEVVGFRLLELEDGHNHEQDESDEETDDWSTDEDEPGAPE